MEIMQLKKRLCDSTLTKYLEQSNLQRRKVEWWRPGLWGGANRELFFNGHRVSMEVAEIDGGDGCIAM